MLKIVAYCRVSTEKEQQLDSLEQQKEFFQEFARQNNYELVNIYADEGITGRQTRKRDDFNRMMRDARKGIFDMLVVKDISRFARNTVDLLTSVRKLKSMNIEVQFITNSYKALGNSEFILTVYGAIAQEESAGLSKKVKFGKNLTAKKGRVPNVVFGYNKLEKDKYNLEINEEEANIVREIFDMYVNKRYGCTKIARILNDRGIRTKRDHSYFCGTAVSRTLKHKIYIGQVVNKQSEVVDFLTGQRRNIPEEEQIVVMNEKLRIIPDDLYYKAQKIMEENTNKYLEPMLKTGNSSKYLYSTLIKCEHCGYSFFRETRLYKNKYIRWKCAGKKTLGSKYCDNMIAIDEGELTKAIIEYFSSILKNKNEFINRTITKYHQILKQKNKDFKTVKELEKEIEKLKKTKQKYVKMYTDELINEDEFKEYTNSVNCKMKDIEKQIKISNFSIASEDTINKDIRKKISEIEKILSCGEFENEYLKKVIDRINVNKNGNVEIILKGLENFDYDNEVIVREVYEENIKENVEKVEDCNGLPSNCKLNTTVHKDVSERLLKINPILAHEVRNILDENKAERHIRGGMATKLKYSHNEDKCG